jgi:lysophospholipase L1-like esterase
VQSGRVRIYSERCYFVRLMLKRLLSLVAILAFVAQLRAQTNPFESDIRAFEAADARSWPAPRSILFIGSSSIVNWRTLAADFPSYNVLNRGFGGSQTSDALYFFDRIVTPYRPPVIVFYEGDNDIAGGKTVDQVFNLWTNFVDRVRAELPNTHIIYISVKPSPSRSGDLGDQRALNSRVREYTLSDPKLHFADVFTPMLTESGGFRPELYVADQLHMTDLGYDIWQAVVTPILDEIAGDYPVQITRPESGVALIDFGAADMKTALTNSSVSWNNVSPAIGGSSTATLSNLVTSGGVSSPLVLRMVSRFNGANENGTTSSTKFPATATRDSLFGNTETFSGLANVTPIFKITGLGPNTACDFTFYASRTGVSDNRQTRYTVTGSSTATADLNAANNIDEVATVAASASGSGEIQIALTPGPNNNNGNHFTYLGVMRLDTTANGSAVSYYFDFGAASSPTGDTAAATPIAWNNLTPEVGTVAGGALTNLVATNNSPTEITLEITSPFNGANANGTSTSTLFPATASQDSLFGNTETFNGQSNIQPTLKLTGLNPSATYDLTFYASRTGVNDNRETRYTVTGAATLAADLDAANNTNNTAKISGARSSASGEIQIALTPGPNNNNANHFTYLGVLAVKWSTDVAEQPVTLSIAAASQNAASLQVSGVPGLTYQLEFSTDLSNWQKLQFVRMTKTTTNIELPVAGTNLFIRALE